MQLLYIDPGSSSMLIQIIAAAVASIMIFFRQIRLFIKNIFTKKDKNTVD